MRNENRRSLRQDWSNGRGATVVKGAGKAQDVLDILLGEVAVPEHDAGDNSLFQVTADDRVPDLGVHTTCYRGVPGFPVCDPECGARGYECGDGANQRGRDHKPSLGRRIAEARFHAEFWSDRRKSVTLHTPPPESCQLR